MVFFSYGLWVLGIMLVLSSLKVVRQYERGVKFTLGKFSGVMQPGLRLIIPIIQSWERVDIRITSKRCAIDMTTSY